MNINKDIYKADWLLYTAYEILKDKDIIDEQYKDILLDLTTLLTNYILVDDGIEEQTEEYINNQTEVNEEIDNLISELEGKENIDNIDKLEELKNKRIEEKRNYNPMDNIINNPSEETKKEVDKLLEELNIELGED